MEIKKLKKINKFDKPKALIIGGIVLVIIYTILMVFYFMSKWYDENRVVFQTPVIFQVPIKIEKREKIIKIIKKTSKQTKQTKKIAPRPQNQANKVGEKDLVMSMPHGGILWKIYGLETTWGKADYCRINNKGFGGFGVMVEGQVYCYPTFKRAVERAEYWLSLLNPDKSLASALCQYNTGIGGLNTCSYYESYLTL